MTRGATPRRADGQRHDKGENHSQIRLKRAPNLRQDGTPIDRTVKGFYARVVQHEPDNLIGHLFPIRPHTFPMRIRDMHRFGFTSDVFHALD